MSLSTKMLKVILLILFLKLCYGQEGCQISIDSATGDLRQPQPLILNGSYQIILPDETSTLSFSNGESILLVCPGKNNHFNEALKSQQTVKASCVGNKTFDVDGESYSFSTFTCNKSAKTEVRKHGPCLRNFSKIEIGFNVEEIFIPVVEICRDNVTDESYYGISKLTKNIAGRQHKIPRPNWITQNVFHSNKVNMFYTKKHQLKNLKMILKSEKLAQSYLKNFQLHRGHLAPKADFIYSIQQKTTFNLANVAPQWSSFNVGNWKYIETIVRDFVVDNNLNLTIYTGVHGQMTLKDVNNNEQPIYLNIDTNNNEYIRVPKFFWKIIYDPVRQLALAIIGLNDPFRDKITEDMFLCPDISSNPSVSWLIKSWDTRMNISHGVSYVCRYEDLKKVVDTVPHLNVKGIL